MTYHNHDTQDRISSFWQSQRQRQDPNCQGADGHPAILVAAAVGSCEILKILLKESGIRWDGHFSWKDIFSMNHVVML